MASSKQVQQGKQGKQEQARTDVQQVIARGLEAQAQYFAQGKQAQERARLEAQACARLEDVLRGIAGKYGIKDAQQVQACAMLAAGVEDWDALISKHAATVADASQACTWRVDFQGVDVDALRTFVLEPLADVERRRKLDGKTVSSTDVLRAVSRAVSRLLSDGGAQPIRIQYTPEPASCAIHQFNWRDMASSSRILSKLEADGSIKKHGSDSDSVRAYVAILEYKERHAQEIKDAQQANDSFAELVRQGYMTQEQADAMRKAKQAQA